MGQYVGYYGYQVNLNFENIKLKHNKETKIRRVFREMYGYGSCNINGEADIMYEAEIFNYFTKPPYQIFSIIYV